MKLLKDSIGIWENALEPSWCEELMRRFDAKAKLSVLEKYPELDSLPRRVRVEEGNHTILGVNFSNNQKRIDDSFTLEMFGSLKPYHDDLLKSLEKCYKEYFQHFLGRWVKDTRSEWSMFETVECKIQRTPPKGGFCNPHCEQGGAKFEDGNDNNEYSITRRAFVWMLYLNDLEESGGTIFHNQDLIVTPKQGTMVIWPAQMTHVHGSNPDLNDWKYIVTGWLLYSIDENNCETSRIRKDSS